MTSIDALHRAALNRMCPKCKAVPGIWCMQQWKPDPGGTKQWRYVDDLHPSRLKGLT